MARTLTEQEQQTLQRLRDRLLRALPSEEKGYAAGIASSLVRIREPKITDADLDRILGKYDTPKENLIKAIKNQLLKPVHGESGAYTLRKKDAKALPAGEESKPTDASQADAKQGESKRSSGERKPRRRSHRSGSKAAADNLDVKSEAVTTGNDEVANVDQTAGQVGDAAPAANDAAAKQQAAADSSPSADHAEPAADIAPGRSIRKAAQAENEADEAAATAEDDAPATSETETSDVTEKRTGSNRSRGRRRAKTSKKAAEESPDKEQAAEEDSSSDQDAAAVPEATADAVSDEASADNPVSGDTHAGENNADSAGKSRADAGADDADSEAPAAAQNDAPATDTDAAAPDKEHAPHGHGKKKKNERDPRRIPYVRRGDDDDAALREKIIQLDQRFWMNGWLLSHPGAYQMFEHELTALSDALADGDVLPGDITRRQLAYQLGGDEKFFEYGSDGFRLLRAMGLESIIRHRPLPKIDLVYHAPRRRKRMRVLVTENLDPYLDVHDLMYEDGRSLFLGERIHAVVLGGGTPVLEHNRLSLLLDTLGADHIDVLYWGDIDRAGLELMCKLKGILGDKYGFEPFTPAYRLMVQRAMERFPNPADNEITGQENVEILDTDLLCTGLTDEEAAYARAVIESCCLIPQEILTKRDL